MPWRSVYLEKFQFEPPVALWFQFALPRGERQVYVESREDIVKFQFALPRGERLYPATFVDALVWFQFALPRGERQPALKPEINMASFNSRSRVGSDVPARVNPRTGKFQFALPRGERQV